MSEIKFDQKKAERAIDVYLKFVGEKANLVQNSPKTVLMLSIIAYLGKVSKKELAAVFPNPDARELKSLVNNGLIVEDKSSRTYYYSVNKTFISANTERWTRDVAYLFVNALFDVKTWVQSYGITGYRPMALAVEATLKTGYANNYVSIDYPNIKTVKTSSSVSLVRSKLVEMGFMKPKSDKHGNTLFKLNRRAYLLGSTSK